MTNTQLSLITGVIAGACTLLVIISPASFQNMKWISPFLLLAGSLLSLLGLGMAFRGINKEGRGTRQWIAVWLNSLILIGSTNLLLQSFDAM